MTDEASVTRERNAFTGKEEDEEVGVTYFGQRYLIQRVARWASPDPIGIASMSGGEAANEYHFVSGNLIQKCDSIGLDPVSAEAEQTYLSVRRDLTRNGDVNARWFWDHFFYGHGSPIFLSHARTDQVLQTAMWTNERIPSSSDGTLVDYTIQSDMQRAWILANDRSDSPGSGEVSEEDPEQRVQSWRQFFENNEGELNRLQNGEVNSIHFSSRTVEHEGAAGRYYRGASNSADDDWYWALGGFVYHFSGTIERGEEGALVVHYQVHISDQYIFDGDEPLGPFGYGRGPSIRNLMSVQESGEATPFPVTGHSSERTFVLPADPRPSGAPVAASPDENRAPSTGVGERP